MQDSLSRYTSTKPLIQPRGGRTTELRQKQLWQTLQDAGCDLLPLTVDSKTRLGQIDVARESYENSKNSGVETLNGFPLLSVDIDLARELIKGASLPVSLRHGTPYAFDLISRAIDIGINEIEGGPLSYSLPYSRDSNLIKVIESWEKSEFTCRNASVPIVRETFGILTACLVPPIVSVLVNLLECAFIEIHKGGTPMASFGATGSAYQDLAAIDAFRSVYPWFKDRLGLPGSNALIAYHHWMGPFPKDRNLAESIITTGTLIAELTRSNKVVTKTIDEALGIPTDAANAAGVRLTKKTLHGPLELLKSDLEDKGSALETELIVRECKFQLGELLSITTNINEMLLISVQSGLIDPPFAPHRACRSSLKALRALDGSVRITSDSPGVFTKPFIDHESFKLGNKKHWGKMTSDKIKLDLQYPFTEKNEVKGELQAR